MNGDQLDQTQQKNATDLLSWSYQESVDRMRPLVARWKSATVELLDELYRARTALRSPGYRTDLSPNGERLTWSGYLRDIGLAQETVRRWLAQYDPKTKSIHAIDPPHDPDPKQLDEEPTSSLKDRDSERPYPEDDSITAAEDEDSETETLAKDESGSQSHEVVDTWEDPTYLEDDVDDYNDPPEPESDTPADIIVGMVVRYYEDLVEDEAPSTAHEVANQLLKHFRGVSADHNRRTG